MYEAWHTRFDVVLGWLETKFSRLGANRYDSSLDMSGNLVIDLPLCKSSAWNGELFAMEWDLAMEESVFSHRASRNLDGVVS